MSKEYTEASNYTFGAEKAVDGIYVPTNIHEFSSITIILKDIKQWWRVDLEAVHCVWAVVVLNRAGERVKTSILIFGLQTLNLNFITLMTMTFQCINC